MFTMLRWLDAATVSRVPQVATDYRLLVIPKSFASPPDAVGAPKDVAAGVLKDVIRLTSTAGGCSA